MISLLLFAAASPSCIACLGFASVSVAVALASASYVAASAVGFHRHAGSSSCPELPVAAPVRVALLVSV